MEKDKLKGLIESAAQGDEASFWQIYELKWKSVLFTAYKVLGNEHDAADAAQEAFVSAYQNIRALRSPDAFNAWMYRILINKCNLILGQRNRKVSYEETFMNEIDERQASPEDFAIQAETKMRILELIDALPPDQRMVTMLYYYEGLSRVQIARAMGISESLVGVRLYRARKTMKKMLEEQGVAMHSVAFLPLLGVVCSEEASRMFGIQTGQALAHSIQASFAALTPAAATAAATTSGISVGTKLVLGGLSAAMVAGGGYAISQNTAPPAETSSVPAETVSQPFDLPSFVSGVHILSSSEEVILSSQEFSSAPSSTAVTTSEQPYSSTSPSSAEGNLDISSQIPIKTLADMIGEQDAAFVEGYNDSTDSERRAALLALCKRHGLESKQLFVSAPELYELYTLVRQDRRLFLIEWRDSDTGQSMVTYALTEKATAIPQSYEIRDNFVTWSGKTPPGGSVSFEN